ncbi:MAG: glycosyltransferase [Candidatus Krumholzibacteriia bacterium]
MSRTNRRSAPSPLLSLAMIVRDGGQDLVRCLTHARSWVDEIIVGDTGSTDGSRELAAALGAQVHAIPWNDHYAAARNAVLDLCRGPWIVVLDADEAVAPDDGRRLRAWVERRAAAAGGRAVAGVLQTRNYVESAAGGWRPILRPDHHGWCGGDPAPGYVPSSKVRLFPRLAGVRFAGRLHETVEESLARSGAVLEKLDAVVHHWGWLQQDPAKLRRYCRLAALKAADDPDHAGAWAELADARAVCGDLAGAAVALERARSLEPHRVDRQLALGLVLLQYGRLGDADRHLAAVATSPGGGDSLRAAAMHGRARAALLGGRSEAVGPLVAAALRLTPDDGSLWHTVGAWHLQAGRHASARRALERARRLLPGNREPVRLLARLAAGSTAD